MWLWLWLWLFHRHTQRARAHAQHAYLDRQADPPTDRPTDRLTDRQIDRQIDRPKRTCALTHTHAHTDWGDLFSICTLNTEITGFFVGMRFVLSKVVCVCVCVCTRARVCAFLFVCTANTCFKAEPWGASPHFEKRGGDRWLPGGCGWTELGAT